ncbi:MAG: hypothetical protein IMZ59_06585 [Actinobacteria bacterium]|nr:hypothetical protein [Actinomycetota bacterium]
MEPDGTVYPCYASHSENGCLGKINNGGAL